MTFSDTSGEKVRAVQLHARGCPQDLRLRRFQGLRSPVRIPRKLQPGGTTVRRESIPPLARTENLLLCLLSPGRRLFDQNARSVQRKQGNRTMGYHLAVRETLSQQIQQTDLGRVAVGVEFNCKRCGHNPLGAGLQVGDV